MHNMEQYTKEVNMIILQKKLNIGSVTLDISDELNRSDKKSVEYRRDDIEKINVDTSKKKDNLCKIVLTTNDSFDCLGYNVGKIGVLNFASSKHPGGGFLSGAMAQEESLCYRSNLYDVLRKHKDFYEYNQENLENGLYSDGIIYSEDIIVFRTASNTNVKPRFQNVITCAAPNSGVARRNGVSKQTINNTMARRIEQIIKVAIDNGVEHLVLGAFGCGVFKNSPEFVADAIIDCLVNKGYGYYFNQVTLAMHDKGENYKAFSSKFKGLV